MPTRALAATSDAENACAQEVGDDAPTNAGVKGRRQRPWGPTRNAPILFTPCRPGLFRLHLRPSSRLARASCPSPIKLEFHTARELPINRELGHAFSLSSLLPPHPYQRRAEKSVWQEQVVAGHPAAIELAASCSLAASCYCALLHGSERRPSLAGRLRTVSRADRSKLRVA